jgi:hypothetical protein
MFHALFASRQRGLLGVMFVVFWVSLFLPDGAVISALLALERGKSICAVPGCGQPVAGVVEYHRQDKPLVGSGEVDVGLCAAHLKNPPRSMESEDLAWGRWLSLFGLLCGGMYVAAFVSCFRRAGVAAPEPPSSAAPVFFKRFQPEQVPESGSQRQDRPVLRFFLITAAAVVGLNVGFWFLARYV